MIALIPIAYLNEECFLSLNTDDKKYSISLKQAQFDLKDILGPEFYEEILTQFDSTFSADNDTLYEDYIKDYLAWQTYFYYLPFANQEATPSGIREFTDENSTLINDVKMYGVEKNVKGIATRFKNEMINYLKLEQSKDSEKFPKWTDRCKDEMNFSITAIDKKSDALIRVNKTISTNE